MTLFAYSLIALCAVAWLLVAHRERREAHVFWGDVASGRPDSGQLTDELPPHLSLVVASRRPFDWQESEDL